MKDETPTRWQTFWSWSLAVLVLSLVIHGLRWMHREDMRSVLKEEAAGAQLVSEPPLGGSNPVQSRGAKLAAREVKPTKARTLATEEDHEALDAIRGGDMQKLGKLLYDDARKPDKAMVELMRKLGNPHPEAPVGPSWDESMAWHEAQRQKIIKAREEKAKLNLDVGGPTPQPKNP